MSPILYIEDISSAISEFWSPLQTQLLNDSTNITKAKIALSIYVWRSKNEDRIRFFIELASGTPEKLQALIELLNSIQITQNKCDEVLSRLSNEESIELTEWILTYCHDCLQIINWDKKIDGMDNCVRLINRYRSFLNEQKIISIINFDEILSTIISADLNITAIIQDKISSVIKTNHSSSKEALCLFEKHCENFPVVNLTLILERALSTNIPIGKSFAATAINNSVHESIPYTCLKTILTSPFFDNKQTFLDLGSGTGTLVNAISTFTNADITGVEIIPEMVLISQAAASTVGCNAKFANQDATNTDLDLFENIIIFTTLHGEPLEVVKKNIIKSTNIKKIWILGFASSKFQDIGWNLLTPKASNELDLQIYQRP